VLFSTQLFAQSVDADGFAELYPVSVLQSDVAESNSMIPIDRKIAIEMKIATRPINDIDSTMIVVTMQESFLKRGQRFKVLISFQKNVETSQSCRTL